MAPVDARAELMLAAGITPERATALVTKLFERLEAALDAEDRFGTAWDAQLRAAKELAAILGVAAPSSSGSAGGQTVKVVLELPDYARPVSTQIIEAKAQ